MLDPTTKDLKTMREEKHECLSMASRACEPHVLVVNPWPNQELILAILSPQTMAWRWRKTRTPIAARTCNLKPLNPAPDWTWVTQLSCFLVSHPIQMDIFLRTRHTLHHHLDAKGKVLYISYRKGKAEATNDLACRPNLERCTLARV